jgi:hypothetical protein
MRFRCADVRNRWRYGGLATYRFLIVRRSKQRLDRRQAKAVGVIGFVAAVALPVLLWRDAITTLASDFNPTPGYFVTAWTPFALIALGLVFLVPVVASIGRSSYAAGYPRRRNVYAGWGVSLYLLGLALASQVATIARGLGPH